MDKDQLPLDWADLQSFLAIARTGNLSAAARILGVTQPTMGRRLKAMEQSMGARLLDAKPGGFALTPLGEALMGHARAMESEALAAARAITGADLRLEGVVRITTVELLATIVVLPVIADLHARHPGLVFELVPDSRALSLSRREADLALRPARFEGASLFARRVGDLRHSIYGAADQVAAQPKLADWPADTPIITVQEEQQHLAQIAWFHQHMPIAPRALTTNDRALQLEACAAGMGLACLADMIAVDDSRIAMVEASDQGPEIPIWLGVHRDLRNTPRIRLVIDALVEACQTKAAQSQAG